MRLNPWRWLWGLVPIAMLCWIALLSERGRIETDLRTRAQAALTTAGMPWAASSFDGRDAVLTGQAAEEAEPDRAIATLRSVWGVRVVDNRTELIEKADVYGWAAAERDGRLRLTGHVPNEATRKAIIGVVKANFPRADVEDRMQPARGAPPRDVWLSGVSFAIKNLAQMKNGRVELEGTALTISGAADDATSYRNLKREVSSALPQGIRLKADRITPPLVAPYTWSARLERNQLALSGHVPSEQQRTQLSNAAKAAFPRSAIIDRMEPGDGAPEGWAAATAAAVRELARLEEGSADLRANQLTIAGMATNDVIAGAVRASLRERLPASIRLVEAIKFRAPAVPTFNPFRTLVEAGPAAVVLSGHAPSEAAKTALGETARARLPGRRIDNQLVVGNGAPAGWQACIQFAMAGLGRLGAGKVTLTNRKLQLTGETTDEALHEALPGEIGQAAGQICDPEVAVTLRELPEPNLTWKATRTTTQVRLEGEVPDAAAKSELAQLAARLFPGVSIIDSTRVAAVPARRWRPVAETGLQQLSRLASGAAEIRGQQLTISGETPEQAVAAGIRDQVRRLANGYSGRETVEVRTDADARRRQETAALEERRRSEQEAAEARRKVEIDRCQETLKRVARNGIILFERASADINARSHATLDELARSLKTCPSVTIEIEGHTDMEGAPDRNQRLSERRAQSVLQYLTESGADPARLVAVGYGQDKPIASNDTVDGRARNRRIEFTVKGR